MSVMTLVSGVLVLFWLCPKSGRSQRDAPERCYRDWFKSGCDFELGKVQFVPVTEGIVVANVIGQKGIRSKKTNIAPVRYPAIEAGLVEVANFAQNNGSSAIVRTQL